MGRKRYQPGQVFCKLKEAEVLFHVHPFNFLIVFFTF